MLSIIILGMGSANERQCYNVMLSPIGRAHTQNDPCVITRLNLSCILLISIAHYSDIIMSLMASQITSFSIVWSGTDQRSSMSLVFVRGIHRWLVDSPHKMPVTWKMFPVDDIIMITIWVNSPNIRLVVLLLSLLTQRGPSKMDKIFN